MVPGLLKLVRQTDRETPKDRALKLGTNIPSGPRGARDILEKVIRAAAA